LPFLKNISNQSATDLELVALYKKSSDLSVLGVLYERYMDLVYGVCLKYLKEGEAAKDATMQVFEELVSKLHKYEVENFKSWLHTLAKNHCLMQLRTPKNLKTVEFNTELMQTGEEVHLNGIFQKEEQLQQLEQCLNSLSAEQKQSVELFYIQNKSYKEISDITGIDWNQVRSLIQNGRRNLKICMDKKIQHADSGI